MTLLVVSTWWPYPCVNGATLRAYHLLCALASRHRVHLVAFGAPAVPSAHDVAHLETFCQSVTVIPRSPFAPVDGARASRWSTTPYSLAVTHDAAVSTTVEAPARNVDLAVGFQLSAARYLAGLSIPVIFEEAEPGQIRSLTHRARSWPQRLRVSLTWWKQARYLRRLIERMAAVTVVSEEEALLLRSAGVEAGRIHLVPNGASSADLARPRIVASPPRVIYPGAITYAPNLEAVVWYMSHVMPRVRAVRPEVEFWVTGDTGSLPIERLPHAEWVRFTGRLPDVRDAVGGSAATVIPLHSGGGTRVKALESLALGTPVVSTSKGVEGLELIDGEDVLIADRPEAFAEAVLRVLGDERLAARLSAAGRTRIASSYTWEASGARLLSVVAAASGGRT